MSGPNRDINIGREPKESSVSTRNRKAGVAVPNQVSKFSIMKFLKTCSTEVLATETGKVATQIDLYEGTPSK